MPRKHPSKTWAKMWRRVDSMSLHDMHVFAREHPHFSKTLKENIAAERSKFLAMGMRGEDADDWADNTWQAGMLAARRAEAAEFLHRLGGSAAVGAQTRRDNEARREKEARKARRST